MENNQLTDRAQKIFDLKYARNEKETWANACARVSLHIASVEDDVQKWTAKFFQMLSAN